MPLSAPASAPSARPLWHSQGWILLCIFLACLVGIASRPMGYLAAFWPANALMLGMLLRNPPAARRASTWVLALLTFIAADLLTGADLEKAISLNLANVVGVCWAWAYLGRQTPEVLRFQRQRSVLTFLNGCLLGALGCTVVGAWPGSLTFDVALWRSIVIWMTTEFYNFILITPVFMAAPKGWFWQWRPALSHTPLQYTLPLVALIGTEIMALVVGGPGAMAFIMPALVWCAMTFGVFPITVISLVICLWRTASIALGAFTFTPDHFMEAASHRTGLALLSLAPLAVASAYSLRSKALQRLNYAISHDFLTGTLSRRAFVERSQKQLMRLEEQGQPTAVLMLDIDHFKQVNDKYGHSQGDMVLQEFASMAQRALRPDDLLGRMGGEEFAILLPRTSREHAQRVAQRLCDALRNHPFPTPGQAPLFVTLSVGVHAVSAISQTDTVEQFLKKADEALYQAKHSGRNQVRLYGPVLAPSSV